VREEEDRAREAERDRMLDEMERRELQRRDSVLSLSQRFSMDNVARVVQYAVRWKLKTRRAKARRGVSPPASPSPRVAPE
jgi:hypothetical protein